LTDGKIIIETDLDSSGIEAGLRRLADLANKGMKATTAAIDSVGKALAKVGGDAGKMAGEFASSFAGIKKTVDDLGKNIDTLKVSVLNMSGEISQLAVSVGEMGDAVGQMGKETGNAGQSVLDLGSAIGTVSSILAIIINLTKVHEALRDIMTGVTKAFGTLFTTLSSHPLLIVTAAVVGVGVAIAALTSAKDAEIEKTEQFNRQLAEEAEAIREVQQARQEGVKAIETEYGYTQTLLEELRDHVNINGEIDEGYEERAAFITGALSTALGIEITIIDGVIQNYEALKKSIDSLILKKKAEAMLNVYNKDYSDAIRGRAEALDQHAEALRNKNDLEAEAKTYEDACTEAKKNHTAAQEEYNKLVQQGITSGKEYDAALWNLTLTELEQKSALLAQEAAMNTLQPKLDDAGQAYLEAETKLSEYNSTIANYENLSGAIATDSAETEILLIKMKNDFKSASESTNETLAQQVKDTRQTYEDRKLAMEQGSNTITQEMVDEAEVMLALSELEYAKLAYLSGVEIAKWTGIVNRKISESQMPETVQEEVRETTDTTVETFDEGQEEIAEAAVEYVETGQEAIRTADNTSAATESAAGTTEAYNSTLEEGVPQAAEAGTSLVEAPNEAIAAADISTAGALAGEGMLGSLLNPLQGGMGILQAAGVNLLNSFGMGISSGNIGPGISAAVHNAIMQMLSTINGNTGTMTEAGKRIAMAIQTGFMSANMQFTLVTNVQLMLAGVIGAVNSKVADAIQAGMQLAGGILIGLNMANLMQMVTIAGNAVTFFVQRVSNGASEAGAAGRILANAAISGIMNANLYSMGSTLGSQLVNGLVNGISIHTYKAEAQARAMALAAYYAAKKALDIRSPSKKAYWLGEMFVTGGADGIEDNIDLVENASEDMAQAIMDNMDVAAAVEKMRLTVALETNKLATELTAKVTRTAADLGAKDAGAVKQTININQPVKSPIETSRELRKVGRELAFAKG